MIISVFPIHTNRSELPWILSLGSNAKRVTDSHTGPLAALTHRLTVCLLVIISPSILIIVTTNTLAAQIHHTHAWQIDMWRSSGCAVCATRGEVINPAHASYLTCTHDAARIRGRPDWSPAQRRHLPSFHELLFPASSPRRPAIPLLSLSLRFAVSSIAHTATDYYTVPFLTFDESFPPSSAIRTLVFIGGSCGLLLQSACMGVGTRTTGEPASHSFLGAPSPTWFWDYFLYQSRSLAIASTVEDERVWQPFSRHSFCSSETLLSLSLHIATTRSAEISLSTQPSHWL